MKNTSKLERLTERIWFYPYEEERDRPNLGYVRGDHWSLAVDAGHSVDRLTEIIFRKRLMSIPLPGKNPIGISAPLNSLRSIRRIIRWHICWRK